MMIARFVALLLIVTVSLFANRVQIVTTEKATIGKVANTQSFVGSVKYSTISKLASQSAAVVEKIFVDVGDEIKAGAIVAVLNSATLDAEIKAKEAEVARSREDLNQATRELERYRVLHNEGSISNQQFEQIKLKHTYADSTNKKTESDLEKLTIEKSNRTIKAPFTGAVTARFVSVGEWASVGTGIITLAKLDSAEVEVFVPIDRLNQLDLTKNIDTEVQGKRYAGVVAGISKQGDSVTRSVPIRVAIKNPSDLIEGMKATVHFRGKESSDVVLVNRDAVINRFGKDVVFYVENGVAKMASVEVLSFVENKAAINSNIIAEGFEVITKGNERIFPDDKVTIRSK